MKHEKTKFSDYGYNALCLKCDDRYYNKALTSTEVHMDICDGCINKPIDKPPRWETGFDYRNIFNRVKKIKGTRS